MVANLVCGRLIMNPQDSIIATFSTYITFDNYQIPSAKEKSGTTIMTIYLTHMTNEIIVTI